MSNKTSIEEDIERIYDLLQWADDNNTNVVKEYKAFENILADRKEKEKYISQIANMLNIAEDQIPIELAVQLTKANAYDSLVEKIKKKLKECENLIDVSQGCMNDEDLYREYGKREILQELLDTENSFQEGEICEK